MNTRHLARARLPIGAFLAAALLLGGPARADAPAQRTTEVMAVYYPHWHKYPKGMEWFAPTWDWSRAEWAFVKTPATRFRGQINFSPFGGYYDGADPVDVETEIALAHNAGIDVFLYDYYWYNGEKTQEEAIEQGFLRAKNRAKMKFALMWCYHERTYAWRRRIGEETRYLMKLAHTPEEFLGLVDYAIAHYFGRPEYYRKDGKLFFSIYNFAYLWENWGKDAAKVRAALAEARRRVRTAGLGEIHFNAQGGQPKQVRDWSALKLGLDSFTDYGFNAYCVRDVWTRWKAGERLFDYGEIDGRLQAHWKEKRDATDLEYYPVVPTGWDATLRCRTDEPFPWRCEKIDYPYCPTFTNNTDAAFEKYLRDAKAFVEADPKRPGLVYINAWNEYTEGCWLLPDRRRGDLKLRAIARVFGRRPADRYVYTSAYHAWEGAAAKNQHWRSLRAPDVENAKYGPHEREGLDVWLADKAKRGEKTPCIVVVHGGGWTMGDRVPAAAGFLADAEKEGVSVVSVGYRFVQDGLDLGIEPPVRACQDDVIAALKYVRAHAEAWNIDVRRIGLTGGSAGACSALFAALQGDCALGIAAVFVESPQTSIDPAEMRAWIPNSRYGAHAFHEPSFERWLENRARHLPWIERYSPAHLLRACTAAKAPVFLYTCPPPPPPGALPKDPTHAAMFCVKFEEIARAKGVVCRRGSRAEFIRVLGR